MKNTNDSCCSVCNTNSSIQFFEIPKVITQHRGYNLGKSDESFWLCTICLLEVFNANYMSTGNFVVDADMSYEFACSDLTILSHIYSEVYDKVNKPGPTTPILKKQNTNPAKKIESSSVTKQTTHRDNFLKKTPVQDGFKSKILDRILLPKEIESQLKKTIVGQDRLVRDLSIASYKYLNSLTNNNIKRSNVLIMGQSGTGKTESVKALSKILERPMLPINCSMLTPTGYRGENLSSIAEKLVTLFGMEKAKNAILYFDEFDKLLDPDGTTETSDFKKSVLPELYKILDGDLLVSSGHKGETISLETKGMMIIMTGAFQKMEDSKNKKNSSRTIGFEGNSDPKSIEKFSFSSVTKGDLISYGFPVELVGRFSIVSHTLKFEKEDYLRILRTSKASVLNEYTHMFKGMGSVVEYTDEFLLSIVDKAMKERTGARTIYSLIEARILNDLYHAEKMVGKHIVIDIDTTSYLDLEENVLTM